MKLLHEYIQNVLTESVKSDMFEHDVAHAIDISGANIKAIRPPVSVQYSDVKVIVENLGTAWVEVKMNHTDNLASPRVFYDGTIWDTTYETPVAKYAIDLLNGSGDAAKFVQDIAAFSGIQKPVLPTTIGGLKNLNAVPLEVMRDFVEARGGRYIVSQRGAAIGTLVVAHYTLGKATPASYLQARDDFYLIGSADPLGLSAANDGMIPKIGGTGDFKMRVSTRSKFYEIQAEVKIRDFLPPNSPFSVLPGSSKINPFTAIATGNI